MKLRKTKGGEIKGHLDIFIAKHKDEHKGKTFKRKDILIHGDPKGLRSFAKLLLRIADLDQEASTLPVGAREHYHLRPGWELSDSSPDEVIVGRLDAKGTGAFYERFKAKSKKAKYKKFKKAHRTNPIATKIEYKDELLVPFFIDAPEVIAIGEHMQSLNKEAYMYSYNWDAFLKAYLAAKYPHLISGITTEPEGSMLYVAVYAKDDNAKAEGLLALLLAGVAHPEDWYRFLEEEGNSIAWY